MEHQEPISKPETVELTEDVVGVDVPPLVVPLHPCGCKNQEVKLHNPIMLERASNGQYWTWSDCCCVALDPCTGMTKWSRTEKSASNFARRYFGFWHNAKGEARRDGTPPQQ